jgi:hypothetical protein
MTKPPDDRAIAVAAEAALAAVLEGGSDERANELLLAAIVAAGGKRTEELLDARTARTVMRRIAELVWRGLAQAAESANAADRAGLAETRQQAHALIDRLGGARRP